MWNKDQEMKRLIKIAAFALACSLFVNCSNTRYLKPGQALYTGASVKINPDSSGKIANEKDVKKVLESKTRPKPNKSILGLKPKLFFYNLAGEPKKPKGFRNWIRNKVGEPPVLMSELKLMYNNDVLKSFLISQGYLQAEVTGDTVIKRKRGKAIYTAITGPRYKINEITFPTDTSDISKIISLNKSKTLLKTGNFYNLDTYVDERIRIDNDLKENGYFYFNPDHIVLQVDSTIGNNLVNVNVRIKNTTPDAALKPYTVKDINIYPSYSLRRDKALRNLEPLNHNDFKIYDDRKTYKSRVFDRLVFFKKDERYNRRDHNQSLNRMVNLGAFQDVRAEFLPVDSFRNNQLDLNIYLTPLKKNSLTFSVTGTNKSNNFIGSEVKVTQTTRNIFRGAEQLDVSASGGFETQYSGQSKGISSYSFTGTGKLTFPRFIVPFYKPKSTNAFIPKTIISLSYQLLNRDTIYQLNSFKAEYGYNWKESEFKEHNFNPATINLVRPSKNKDLSALRNLYAQNPGLEYTLQDQFIIGSNYNFTFSNQMRDKRRHNLYFFGGVETSGNVWGLLVPKGDEGEKQLFNIPLTQFVRLETDLRSYYKVRPKVIWANRLNIGYGYAYGSSTSLPFVRQFFAGGSNDVRAFRARSLGPGTFKISNEANFADQGGDIKLMANSELRFKIVSILHGAAFVDAGNIWLRQPDSRPGTDFKFKNALSELAIGTGLGLRVDATIFVVRVDGSFPIRKPYLPRAERWVIDDINFGSKSWRSDNLVINIGIGYPF
jgi:outer membrane protein assembly factor BamA